MTTLRLLEHNMGDVAALPPKGWDVACLTERSRKPIPGWAERHTSKRLKGLAIDWNPDVLTVRKTGSQMAHPGLAKFSPNRGTIWVEGSLTEASWIDVSIICSHRLNDPDGSARAFGPMRKVLWRVHEAQDRRIITRLERRGFLVLFGGDINDRRADLKPLIRELEGHYDAIGYSRDERLRLVGIDSDDKGGSDHHRFTATFQIKET